MNQSKFVKSAIAAAILGVAAFGAQAASITGSAKYAVELFGGTAPQTAITLPSLTITAATAIPAASTVTVMVQFIGGRPAAAPGGITTGTGIVPTATAGSTLAASTAAEFGTGAPTATANNGDVLVYTLTGTTSGIGIGGNLITIPALTVTAAGLATLGNTVTAIVSVFVGAVPAPVGTAVPTTGLLEPASGATAVATSAQGVSLTGTAGGTTQKIDISATTPASVFSTGGAATPTDTGSTLAIQLGTLGQVNGTAKKTDGITAYTTTQAGADGTTVVTVTAPAAGFFGALGTTGTVSVNAYNANSCGGAVIASSALFGTKAAAAAATKVTIPATALGASTGGATPQPFHVCMSIPGTAGLLVPGTALFGAVLGQTTEAQDSSDTLATTALATLANNGATVTVNSYFPNALSTYGYSSYLRITNTGAVSAPVSVAVIDPVSGIVGTAQVLGTLPAGAATTFTAAQVEAAIGIQAIAARPRLLITAPTATLAVQSFLQAPTGAVSVVSGGSN